MRRKLVWIAASVLAVIVLVVVIGWGWLRSRAGQEWERKRLVERARATIPGFDVERLEQKSDGEIVLHNVVIRDREGRDAVRIAEVRLRVDLYKLTSQKLDADRIAIVSPRVQMARGRSGQWNLSELVVPQRVDAGAGPMTVDIRAFEIQGGAVDVALDDGTTLHAADITLSSAVHERSLDLRAAAATIAHGERRLSLDGSGHVTADGDQLKIHADAQMGAGTMTLDGTAGAQYELSARVHDLDLRSLGLDVDAGPLGLRAGLRGHGDESNVDIDLDPWTLAGVSVRGGHAEVALAGSTWRLERAALDVDGGHVGAHGEGRPGHARIDFDGTLDARRALAKSTCDPRGTIRFQGAFVGASLERLDLTARLGASGLRLSKNAEPVSLALALETHEKQLRLSGSGEQGSARGTFSAHGLVHADQAALTLDRASVTLDGQSYQLDEPAELRWRRGGDLSLPSLHIRNDAGDRASGHATFGPRMSELGFDATAWGGQVHIDARLPVASGRGCTETRRNGAMAVHVRAAGLSVERMPQKWHHGVNRGTWSAAADIGGDSSRPSLKMHAELADATVGTIAGMAASLDITSDGGPLHVSGATTLHGRRLAVLTGGSPRTPAELAFGKSDDVPATLDLEIPSLDLATLPELTAAVGPPLAGKLGGHLHLDSAAGHTSATGQLAIEGARVGVLDLGRVGLTLRDQDGSVHGELSATPRGGGSIHGGMSIDPAGTLSGDLHVRGIDATFLRGDATWLRGSPGRLDADLLLSAPKGKEPRLAGALRLDGSSLRPVGLPTLRGLDLQLTITPGLAVLERMQARIDAGSLEARASIKLDGLKPRAATLTATAKRLHLIYGGLDRGLLDAEWTLEVPRFGGPVTPAKLTIARGSLTLPDLTRQRNLWSTSPLPEVRVVKRGATASKPAAPDVGRLPEQLDLSIATGAPFHVHARQLDADVEVQLALSGPVANLTASGDVGTRSGELRVLHQKFDLERVRFFWKRGALRNPSLDIRVTRQYPEAFATLRIGGTYDHPELGISSDPPMEQMELLNLIVTGRSGQTAFAAAPGQAGVPTSGTGALSLLMVNALLAVVAPNFGLDTLRVDVNEVPASASNPLATTEKRVEAGFRVGDKMYISGAHISDAAQNHNSNEAQVEYRIARRWLIESVLGDVGSGVDLFWIYRY
jgi:hypothetical protein